MPSWPGQRVEGWGTRYCRVILPPWFSLVWQSLQNLWEQQDVNTESKTSPQLPLQLSSANHSPNTPSTLATLLGAERGSGLCNLALSFAFHFLISTLFFLFLKDVGDIFSDVFSDPGSPDAKDPLAGFRTLGTGESHLSYDKATRSKAAAMLG